MKGTTRVLTGFPASLLAVHVLWKLVEQDERVTCIVPARFVPRAHELLLTRSAEERARVEILEGDVAAMDLGLSGREFMDLASRTRLIHHCAAVTYSGAPLEMAERVNVNGTREALELALASPRLQRLVHWSSTLANCPQGAVAYEDELHEPPRGRIARTRYRAEKLLLRFRGKVPITVLRPAMLVGDSRSGEAARVEGALLLISVLLSAPRDVALPLPARADAPLNIVPLDYAVKAGLAIANAADSASRTYHIVDERPSSLGDALSLFAGLTHRPAPKRFYPNPFSWALLRMPGIERTIHAQRALLDDLGRGALYDDRNARPILERAGLRCPPLQAYGHKLVAYVEREREAKDGRSSRPPAVAT